MELNKEQSISFWKERLADIEPLDLSFLRFNSRYNLPSNSRSIPELSTKSEIRFTFDKETLFKLDRLRKKYKISPYLYGQSILAILLNKYTDQDRFCISFSVVIKEEKEFLYGAHVNTNVILYDFSKINNIIDVINQSREFLKTLKHGDVNHSYLPVSEIIAISNKDLLNLSFIQVNLENKVSDCDNIKASIKNRTNIAALTNDLAFEQEITNKEVNYRVQYNLDKIHANLLSEFIVCYKRFFIERLDELLECKRSSKLTHIKNYSLLSIEQYEQIVHTWNQTDKDYPHDKTMHQLFEEQVERTPDNIAVVYEETKLTYKELNERANQLASYLRQTNDIKPDTLIALYLDRSEHMLIAILAVLKSGGGLCPYGSWLS